MIQWKQQAALIISIAGLAMPAMAIPANFERYRIILDKAPFGSVEAPPPPMQAPPPPRPNDQKAWTKNYRLTMLQEEINGTLLVGIVNNQNQQSILLKEGETDPTENIKFISGDYETGNVTLSKSGDVRQLGPDDNQTASAPPPQASPTASKPTINRVTRKNGSRKSSSYAARRASRQKRLADLRKQREKSRGKAPALPSPVLQQHLENMQMETIRKGAPPLPVPLTPAMEQQLINEGLISP